MSVLSAHILPKVIAPKSPAAGFVMGTNWTRPAPEAAMSAEVEAPLPATASLENAPAVLQGILSHFVDADLRPKLREDSDNLRLSEDLGLDSLTMMEVMMRVEDLLKIRVSDDQLRHFRTLGEVRQFIELTSRGMTVPLPAR